jgi:transcriptional regulator GlxA family with amidase domain
MTTQKTIGIIVFDAVLTSEVTAPAEVFGMARENEWFQDWNVVMIGVNPDQKSIKTAEGLRLEVDYTIEDDLRLDVLIVPGAYDMDHLFANEKLNAFINEHEKLASWVSSNCSGAFLLASAGVLDGMKATTYFGGEASLQEQYPQIEVVFDHPVVVDHRRLTSNGGVVSYQAAVMLLAQLTSPEHAKEVYDGLQIGRMKSWAEIEGAMA